MHPTCIGDSLAQREDYEQLFFHTRVMVCHREGKERTYSLAGVDETDVDNGRISWVSPLARTLLKACAEDAVMLQLPDGVEELGVVEVIYRSIEL